MSPGSVVFVVAVAVVVVAGAVLVLTRMRAQSDESEREARQLAGDRPVLLEDTRAELVGRASVGRAARGRGTLLLTDRDLVWVMNTPRRSWTIPRDRIDGVERPDEFLRLTAAGPLLQVDHRDESGATDATAWSVVDLDAWAAALRSTVEPT